MPDPETVLRENAARFGWEIREMPAIPAEDGWIEVRAGRAILRALIPRDPDPAYDPWDRLYQACAALTMPPED